MSPYKHGKPDAMISLEDLKKRLRKVHLKLRQKAYVIFLYWSGCRRREPLFLSKEDVEEKDGSLYFHLTVDEILNKKKKSVKIKEAKKYKRCKRGQAGGAIELSLDLWGLDIIQQVWIKTRKKRKLFNFTDQTGYRAVKKLYPNKSPHWFRYNRITFLREKRDEGKLTIDEIKSFTGIRRDRTIENYGLITEAGVHKVSKILE